jgi:AbrB family looped-hinge helix DNA binding protein
MKEVLTVSTRGQIVIPLEARERLGIKAGTKLQLRVSEGRLELSPVPEDLIGHLCGVIGKGASLSEALLEERRKDGGREEKEASRFTRGAKVSSKGKGF